MLVWIAFFAAKFSPCLICCFWSIRVVWEVNLIACEGQLTEFGCTNTEAATGLTKFLQVARIVIQQSTKEIQKLRTDIKEIKPIKPHLAAAFRSEELINIDDNTAVGHAGTYARTVRAFLQ
mmetsp:Transcript_39410/g.79585  ORF Transcript_39410/g.79585 Transcript_39410/m.79585 type:complete len:121 (-) Transcript_39410:289-651(-)